MNVEEFREAFEPLKDDLKLTVDGYALVQAVELLLERYEEETDYHKLKTIKYAINMVMRECKDWPTFRGIR